MPLYVPPAFGGSGHTIKDEGTPLTARSGLNFAGATVTVTDDAVNDETDVTISAAAASHTHPQSDVTNLTSDLAGKQSLDTDLTAIAALTSAADKVPYATGAGTWALTDFTAAARSLMDDTTVAAMRATLDVPSNAEAILDALVDFKGDLIVATAADTPARLAVGASGQVLTVDQAAETGVKWATPSGSAPLGNAWGPLLQSGGRVAASTAASTRLFTTAGAVLTATGASTTNPADLLYIDDADFLVTGLTTRLRVTSELTANATAPAASFTVGLYPVTAVAGPSGSMTYTLGTVVAGSTATFTTPAASTQSRATTSEFAVPADGYYVLGVAVDTATAASSEVHLTTKLQIRHT